MDERWDIVRGEGEGEHPQLVRRVRNLVRYPVQNLRIVHKPADGTRIAEGIVMAVGIDKSRLQGILELISDFSRFAVSGHFINVIERFVHIFIGVQCVQRAEVQVCRVVCSPLQRLRKARDVLIRIEDDFVFRVHDLEFRDDLLHILFAVTGVPEGNFDFGVLIGDRFPPATDTADRRNGD